MENEEMKNINLETENADALSETKTEQNAETIDVTDENVNDNNTSTAYDADNTQAEGSDETVEERDFVAEILEIIMGDYDDDIVRNELDNYHENDIAEALTRLEITDRVRIYHILGDEKISEIFTYIDDVSDYLEELGLEKAADVIENMDADDAVDVLEEIEDDETREQIISLMEPEATEDIKLIRSYDDDKIGSMMTTNYISVPKTASIKQAMRELVSQAGENDNINTIYVYDEEEKYYGAIDLRDLIVARKEDELESVISTGFPCINANEKISDSIADLKAYAEDSLPVVDDDMHILGVITSTDIVEAVDDEMSEDYAKFAAMTEETDVNEGLLVSLRKRLPWLILLLFLGMGVSSVVGIFEGVVQQIAVIVCFQSLILGMSGNVGTQSLAVTIRVLMNGSLSGKEKVLFALKEIRVGATNGTLLGLLALVFVTLYLHIVKDLAWGFSFAISACVAVSLPVAMLISSFVGVSIPMLLHKLKFDPAVASGPLITTMNDLIAVITYYGLSVLLLIKIFGF